MPQMGRAVTVVLALCLLVAVFLVLHTLGSGQLAPSLPVASPPPRDPPSAGTPSNAVRPPTVLSPDAVVPAVASLPAAGSDPGTLTEGGEVPPPEPRWAALPPAQPETPGHLLPLYESLIPLQSGSNGLSPTGP